MHALHHTPLADLANITLPVIHERKCYELLYTRVRLNFLRYLQPDICEEIAASFETFLDTPQNFTLSPVLVHGNFGPHRILYNAKVRSISGITGFTQIGLGDPAKDVAALLGPRGYNGNFVKHFERVYPDFQALRERIQFYVNVSILGDALSHLEPQQLENIARKLTCYRL